MFRIQVEELGYGSCKKIPNSLGDALDDIDLCRCLYVFVTTDPGHE